MILSRQSYQKPHRFSAEVEKSFSVDDQSHCSSASLKSHLKAIHKFDVSDVLSVSLFSPFRLNSSDKNVTVSTVLLDVLHDSFLIDITDYSKKQ